MSSLSVMDKKLLIAKINDGSFVLDDLSIDRCPKLETGDISRDVLKQVYARMVEEVFKTFHMDKEEAIICFRKCVKKLLANKASLLTSSNPAKARRLRDRVDNGIRLFAAKAYMKDL
ncbi:hypothetical protein FBULB1_11636 [Fusarium bulbicola]|nr:hypothetical protein FBULB1_11636 [Fusarium bulbicola]